MLSMKEYYEYITAVLYITPQKNFINSFHWEALYQLQGI